MSYFDQAGLPFADYLQGGTPEAVATLAAIAQGIGYSDRITNETPIGAIDGQNATFTTAFDFVPESVEVVWSGVTLRLLADYTTTGNRTILLTQSPQSGEWLTVSYLRS